MNKIYHLDFLQNSLPDKCANLIIADPPYFEVKGDFDFIWPSFDAYLQDVEKWAKECNRILSDNGTLFWWGMDKKIAYSQVILDRYFNLINTLVWERPGLSAEWDTMRSFPARGMERVLMYANDYEPGEWQMTGWERVLEEKIKPRHPFANYLKSEFERAGVTAKEIAALFPSKTGGMTGCVSNWLNGDNVITKEQYLTIRHYLNNDYLRAEYEELRAEYEELRRPFNNFLSLTDVLKFSQDAYRNGDFEHDTKKPEKLTRALLLTCSRENDLVVVPFAGSGTECAAAAKEGRRYVGFDIDAKHVATAMRRCTEIRKRPELFHAPEQMYNFEQAKLFE